ARMSPPRGYYDAGSLHIESYDSIYEPLPEALAGDIAFYAELARRGGGRVLEIGCGTGRVALALAGAGFDIVGMDRSEEMLAQARRQSPYRTARRGLFRRLHGRRGAPDSPRNLALPGIRRRRQCPARAAAGARGALDQAGRDARLARAGGVRDRSRLWRLPVP